MLELRRIFQYKRPIFLISVDIFRSGQPESLQQLIFRMMIMTLRIFISRPMMLLLFCQRCMLQLQSRCKYSLCVLTCFDIEIKSVIISHGVMERKLLTLLFCLYAHFQKCSVCHYVLIFIHVTSWSVVHVDVVLHNFMPVFSNNNLDFILCGLLWDCSCGNSIVAILWS